MYDRAFPLTICKNTGWNKPRQPWMTTALLKSCKKKSRLYKKYLANPTNHNKQIFTRYRNKFKAVRLESESRYYSDRFTECSNNLNKTWKIIKQILNSNEAVGLPQWWTGPPGHREKSRWAGPPEWVIFWPPGPLVHYNKLIKFRNV